MKIDRTEGLEAKWLVSINRWNVDDFYYFHYYKDAKTLFDDAVIKEKGATISIWDMKKDTRKDYTRV